MYKATASGTGQRSGQTPGTVPISLPQRTQRTRQPESGSRPVPMNLPSRSQPRASATPRNATNLTPLLISTWVLLVVQTRGGLKLAQLRMQGLSSVSFFAHLRSEYYRLRGPILRCFSVWVCSHCDFYKVRFSALRSQPTAPTD